MLLDKDWICVFLGDTHTLGSTGIAIPGYAIQSEGGRPYSASREQIWLYDCWMDFYNLVKQYSTTYRIALMYGGDGIDGPGHHGTFQTMGDRSDAIAMTVSLFQPFNALASARLAVTGTSAHTGPAGDDDRIIAAELGAEIRDVWEDLVIDGRKLLWSHHGVSVGQRENNKDGGSIARAKDKDEECTRFPDRYRPDTIISHDQHRSPEPVTIRNITVAVTPCWQMPTRWAVQKFPYKQVDIGGLMWHPKTNSIYRRIYPKLRMPVRELA